MCVVSWHIGVKVTARTVKGKPSGHWTPGAESRGHHPLYWHPGGTATGRLSPGLEMGNLEARKTWTASFSASSKQGNTFLYWEIPLRKRKQTEAIFTAD